MGAIQWELEVIEEVHYLSKKWKREIFEEASKITAIPMSMLRITMGKRELYPRLENLSVEGSVNYIITLKVMKTSKDRKQGTRPKRN